ncbi:uncharacterized protein LOC116303960 [Actinia tenebrosa]|uniref:Uncharacterized protein LOC116303960 n=1 Tax=Actinia tenebrosa TaxID=6105 RepID=A0A6P8IT64_ACTTE|nr:uncharacterized protein LOC116303960 [Actinia tenebrosa]
MVCKLGFVFVVLISVGSTLGWPWRSDPAQQEHLTRQKRSVECKNHLDCFQCDQKKRQGQCAAYLSVCQHTCNPDCASTPFADEPYKPCADIKAQGDCLKAMPYSSSLWLSVCEKSCCVLENPPKWSEWSDWGSCSKSCDHGFKTRTRVCQGEGFGQTCEGSPFESAKCNVGVPCKGTVGWKDITTTVEETVGKVTLTIVRTVKTDCDASIKVNTKDGTAVQPDDYVKIEDLVIDFATDETEKTVTFTINKDKLIEPLESFTAVITADPNKLNVDPAVTTINIKDCTAKIGLRPDKYEVQENLKIVKVTVFREGCLRDTNKVCISTVDGTAKAVSDYVAISKQEVSFAPTETSKEISITIVNDGVEEQDEDFSVELGCADPATLIVAPGKATVVVKDDDVDGNWSDWGPYGDCSKTCGSGVQTRSRTCTNPKPQGGGKDCEGLAVSSQACNTHKCPINGSWSEWGPWSEGTRTCGGATRYRTRTCTNPPPQYGGLDCEGPEKETQGCNNEPCPAQVGLKPKEISVLENVGKVEITVFRVGNSIGSNKCKLNTVAGSAEAGKDFDAIADLDVIFEVGEETKTVSVNIIDDKELEESENFQVKLSCSEDPSVTEVNPDTTTITITDDDVQIGFDPTSYSVRETDGQVTLKVFRKGYLKEPNTAIVNTCDLTAKAPEDFTALADFEVSFAAGETSKDVVVSIVDDKVLEDVETFCATLSTEDPKVSKVDPAKAEISIVDNDVKVGFRPDAYEIVESKPYVIVKVYRVGNLKGVTKVILNTIPDSASEGSDFTPLEDVVVTFLAGESIQSFKVNIVDNNIVESLESFTVKMTTKDTDVTKILPDVATIKIIDDDAVFSIEQPQYCVLETAGSLTVKITRKGATTFEHNAILNTQDVSAIAPADYEKITDLGVKFGANELEKEVTVNIVDDNAEEGPEKFKLVLTTSDPRATVENGVAVINIEDNDIDGKYSEWSAWSACGKSCGQSSQSRTRVCDPAPQGGGAACSGPNTETKSCFVLEHCPVDGGFSDYAAWGDCSRSCGGGFQLKYRTCTNPAPQYGGKPCVGTLVEAQACNDKCCPVDGQWSYYGSWSECKDGKQSRTRKCNNPAPSCGGKDCEGGAGAATQTRDCPPPSPCVYESMLTLSNRELETGEFQSKDNEIRKSCKSGTQSRTRTCTNPAPANGGKKCVGDSSQSRVCNKNVPCPVSVRFHPLNYKVVESDVNDVTVKIVRSGDLQQATTVFLSTVDGTAKKLSDYRPRNKLPVKFKPGQKERKVRIDIINDKKVEKASENFFAKLTSDSPSVKIVPSGSKATIRIDDDDSVFRFKKIRYVVKENVGKVNLVILRSGATNKKQTARIQTKDGTAVSTANGDFQSVGNPTPLSVVFGPGEKHKTVSVKINDDKICEKRERFTVILSTKDNSATVNDKFDVAVVDILDNDVNGGWGKWSPWGKCDKPCGKGRKYRSRKCNNPAPQGGGRKCRGSPRQSAYCYVKRYCPINGGYGEWSKWSSCSRSCGAGSRTRTRVCNKPKPQYGGKPCDGVPKQTRKCYLRACPYAGNTPTPPPYKPPETKPPAYQPPPPYNPY